MISMEQIIEAAIDWAADREIIFVHGKVRREDDVTAHLLQLVSDYAEENMIER